MNAIEDPGRKIAEEGLSIGAIKLNPDNPFQWASGYRMPIYNDNRMFLFLPDIRKLITRAFAQMIYEEEIPFDIIAGTATAGIPHGVSLADLLSRPFIYIRDKPKSYGLKNRIEGIGATSDLDGKRVIIIEDLISTGGSSVQAVEAAREANGTCDYCLSIFSYGLERATEKFTELDPPCTTMSLLTFDVLLDIAETGGYLSQEQISLLADWREDPFNWGEKHGFPKIE